MVVSDAKHLPVCMFGTICKLQKWCLCAEDLFLICKTGKDFSTSFYISIQCGTQHDPVIVWLDGLIAEPASLTSQVQQLREARRFGFTMCQSQSCNTEFAYILHVNLFIDFLAFLVTVPIAGVIILCFDKKPLSITLSPCPTSEPFQGQFNSCEHLTYWRYAAK